MKNLFLIFLIGIIFSSCSTIKMISSTKYELKTLKLKGDKRVVHVIYDIDSNRTYTLSEPPPDVILEKTLKVLNNTNVGEITSEQRLDLSNKAIALGERTVAVNILRDALYRLSEMSINNRNQPLESGYKALFDSILSVSKSIAIVQVLAAEADKLKAEAENNKAVDQKNKSEIKLLELNLEISAYDNYQTAIQFLIDKDFNNAMAYFKGLYEKYPSHFNISEIYDELKKLSNKNITSKDWKSLYQFIINKKLTWRIKPELIEKLKEFAK